MHAGQPWGFLVGLPQGLASALGVTELEAATRPPDGVVRRLESDRLGIGDRSFPSPIPRVTLDLGSPVPAADLCIAWGIEALLEPWSVGRWDVRLRFVGGPPQRPSNPASGEVAQIEVSLRPVGVSLVDRVDPAARALLAAMSTFYPAWRGGWGLPKDAAFVVVHAESRPVAGAAIVAERQGIASVSCLCVDPDRLAGTAGSALLDALEAVALDRGCRCLHLDDSAFLHREHIPYLRHGYVVAPPYDGDADAAVWAQKDLQPPSPDGARSHRT